MNKSKEINKILASFKKSRLPLPETQLAKQANVEGGNDMEKLNVGKDAEVVAEAIVEAPAVEEPAQALGFTKTGAIGSMAADGPKKTVKVQGLGDKVAIHSTKSVYWSEVGSVTKGYNIVTKQQADKWLTRKHVRIAEPEEVKKAFGL